MGAPYPHNERDAQVFEGRKMNDGERPTLSVRHSHNADRRKGDKKKVLAGHEAFLKALEMNGADVVLEKVSSGQTYFGKVKHSDKFTITLNVTSIKSQDGTCQDVEPADRVIYKHDISEFYTTTPRPGE